MTKHYEENLEWDAMKVQALHDCAQENRARSGPPTMDDAVTGEMAAMPKSLDHGDAAYLLGFGVSVLVAAGLFMTLVLALLFSGCATVLAGGPWPTSERGGKVVVREREVPGTEKPDNVRIRAAALSVVNPTADTHRVRVECPLSVYSHDDFLPGERSQWFTLPPHTEYGVLTYIEGQFYGRAPCFAAEDLVQR